MAPTDERATDCVPEMQNPVLEHQKEKLKMTPSTQSTARYLKHFGMESRCVQNGPWCLRATLPSQSVTSNQFELTNFAGELRALLGGLPIGDDPAILYRETAEVLYVAK